MNKFIIALNNLNLKKAVIAVFVLSLGLSIPLIALLLKNETTIFSSASKEGRPNQNILDESKVPYPTEPPQISHVTKFYGRPGDSILIYGKNFGEAQKESFVKVGNTPILRDQVVYWSDGEVEVELPDTPGLFKVSININGKTSTWIGMVDIYTPLTTTTLFINEESNLIRSPKTSYKLKIFSVSGDVKVFGTSNVTQQRLSVPIELADSNILYIELYINGKLTPFKVENF